MSQKKSLSAVEAVAFLGLVYTLIRPGQQTAQVLTAMNNGFAASIRAATGTSGPTADMRTPAQRFHEEATAVIGDFWRGFNDDYTL